MAAGVVYYYCSPCPFEFYFSRFFFVVFFFWTIFEGSKLSLFVPRYLCVTSGSPESDLDLELRGGGGGGGRFFVPCPVGFSTFCHNFFFFFFLPKLRGGGGGGGLGLSAPSPRSTTGLREVNSSLVFT